MSDDPQSEPDAAAIPVGVEQFQKAAVDALRAARALLDAAEAIVTDPKAIEAVVSSVSGMARDLGQTVAGFAAGAGRSTRDDASSDDDDDGFETIQVS